MTRRPETLDELRVGDEVAVMPRSDYGVPIIGTVERVTKTQAIVDGLRFGGRGYYEVGTRGDWLRRRLAPLDDRILAQIDKAKRIAAAKSLAETIAKADLTHDQIARIRAVLEGSEG